MRPLDERKFDEFSTEEIGARLWHHRSEWSQGPGRNAQLIVVDHKPPPEVWGSFVVSFSGRAERPYGTKLHHGESGATRPPPTSPPESNPRS